MFLNKDFLFFKAIFTFKLFWKNNIKYKFYFLYINYLSNKYNSYSSNILYKLNKVKSSYTLTVIYKSRLILSISLGTILKYLSITTKSVKRSKKGFLTFLNIFKNIFLRFKLVKANKLLHLNFFDFYLLFFFKKLNFIFYNNIKLLINLNVNTNYKYFKKIRGIKKRITKKKLNFFLKDWTLINNKKLSVSK